MTAKDYSEQGKMHFEQKQYVQAYEAYNKAIELDNTCVKAWHGKGNIYMQ